MAKRALQPLVICPIDANLNCSFFPDRLIGPEHEAQSLRATNHNSLILQNTAVLGAGQKVLFYIYKRGRRYRANVSQVSRDPDLSDGNVNQYENRLKRYEPTLDGGVGEPLS